MKFLVVSSPHGYTTRDVWMRVIRGLEACGQDVKPYDLLPRWGAFDAMLTLAHKAKVELPPPMKANLLAYEPIFGAAHWHEVDAVIVVSPQYCPMPTIDMLRHSGIKTIGYFTECPYEDTLIAPQQAQHFDYVAVNDRNSVGLYESFCPNVFYLPHSYDPDIHYPPAPAEREDKVIFVGTGYQSRREFLGEIDWSDIPLEMYGLWWMPPRWKVWQGVPKLRRYVRGDVMQNERAADLYRRSAVGLSIHRTQRYVDVSAGIDENEAYSVGPRTFELAACGTLQVSDYRQELVDIFGDAVPMYDTPAELEAILRHALGDPAWRDELAERQRQAVQDHTCEVRMRYLLDRVA